MQSQRDLVESYLDPFCEGRVRHGSRVVHDSEVYATAIAVDNHGYRCVAGPVDKQHNVLTSALGRAVVRALTIWPGFQSRTQVETPDRVKPMPGQDPDRTSGHLITSGFEHHVRVGHLVHLVQV